MRDVYSIIVVSILSWSCLKPAAAQSMIRLDESLIFFPTAASAPVAGEPWKLRVHGWIFEAEVESKTRRAILKAAQIGFGQFAENESVELLQRRLGRFLVDNERGKIVSIRFAEESFPLEPSDADGHFEGQVELGADAVERQRMGMRLEFQALMPDNDERIFSGYVYLLRAASPLVISDIDDTVKVTEVRDKRRAIRNSLLRPFVPVPGMSELYRDWENAGASFFFVSGSPWQLFPDLANFFQEHRFPGSAITLRKLRWKEPRVLEILDAPEAYKLAAIRHLLKTHPAQLVILVGDSGERDPEVYGQIAREFPDRVRQIFIRNVTSENAGDDRLQAAFRDVPAAHWRLFENAEELPKQPF